jgi:hypothetical protein
MHIRTQAIGLMPEIEDSCMTDLATCKNPEVKGEVRKTILLISWKFYDIIFLGNEMFTKKI